MISMHYKDHINHNITNSTMDLGEIFKTSHRAHINNTIKIHNSNQPNCGRWKRLPQWMQKRLNPRTNATDLEVFERGLSGGEIREGGCSSDEEWVGRVLGVSGWELHPRPRGHLPLHRCNAADLSIACNAVEIRVTPLPRRPVSGD